MNLLDAYVEEVLGIEQWTPPEELFPKYIVSVTYTCWSPVILKTNLQFDTLEEAEGVKKGHKFWA